MVPAACRLYKKRLLTAFW